MRPNWLRLMYMIELLIALVATLELWSQVGGQGHLDLMPWYTKLGLTMGMALVTVMGTVSATTHERAWNAQTIACLALAVLLACGMAGASYYYHLHENDDADPGTDAGVATSQPLGYARTPEARA